MRYWPTILLALMYVISIMALYGNWPSEKQDWIYAADMPMSVTWNIRYLSSQIMWIVAALLPLYYRKTPNTINRSSMIVFLLWTILDTICYFYNYKTEGYYVVYGILAAAWLLIYVRITPKKWNTQTRKK